MRLERLDSYLKTFTARVVAVDDAADGRWLRLDRSAFYPTAGGQPHDTGTLGDRRVVDVVARGGEVWHRLEPGGGEPLAVGATVVGVIDWERRFGHMQRHTGQHLLSQAFVRVGQARGADYATRSVSLRGPDCTLDLAGEPDADALLAAEAEADRAARLALPVSAFEVEDRWLGDYSLRRPAKVTGLVRLVAIGDYDLVACGGTHVRSSAEVLPIKLLGRERIKGGLTRVTFRVGAEALADYAAKHAVATELGASLSVAAPELPARVTALQEQLAAGQAELAGARALAAEGLASDALGRAEQLAAPSGAAGYALVSQVLEGERVTLFEALVERLQRAEGSVSLLAAVGAEGGVRLAFVAGPGAEVDVRPALRAALSVVSGRGGGRPDRAQGAGEHGELAAAALEAARGALVSGS